MTATVETIQRSAPTSRPMRSNPRWARKMTFQLSADITEEISRMKGETYRLLTVDAGLLESEADALIDGALADMAGYRGTEKLEHCRRQLADLRRDILGDAQTEA